MNVWLRPNRRVMGVAMILAVMLSAAGLAALLWGPRGGWWWGLRAAAWIALPAGAAAALLVGIAMRAPRLAFDGQHLLVYLGLRDPVPVPIGAVECFFLGQAPSMIPARGRLSSRSSAVVVRLAEKATAWRQHDVLPALGRWVDGYIVIRGTWCEPIGADVLQRLNERLVEAHRAVRESPEVHNP